MIADEIELSPINRRTLPAQVILVYTGVTRSADTILREQSANVTATLPQLNYLRDLAAATSECLRGGDAESGHRDPTGL